MIKIDCVKKQLSYQTVNPVWKRVGDAVLLLVRNPVYGQVWGQGRNQGRNPIWRQVWEQIKKS